MLLEGLTFCSFLVNLELHLPNLMQDIIVYQMFNTNKLSRSDTVKSPEGCSMIIAPAASWENQTLPPDSMDPSKALSETNITDKVHGLSGLPLPSAKPDMSTTERRTEVIRYLLECYGRVTVEKNFNKKVRIYDKTLILNNGVE